MLFAYGITGEKRDLHAQGVWGGALWLQQERSISSILTLVQVITLIMQQ